MHILKVLISHLICSQDWASNVKTITLFLVVTYVFLAQIKESSNSTRPETGRHEKWIRQSINEVILRVRKLKIDFDVSKLQFVRQNRTNLVGGRRYC